MPIHPDIRGGKVPRYALAAAALFSLAVEFSSSDHSDDSSPNKEIATSYVVPPKSNILGNLMLHNTQNKLDDLALNPLANIGNKANHKSKSTSTTSTTTTTTTTAPPPPLTPAQIAANSITPTEFAEWSKVNQCEQSGNWYVYGPNSSGGLGIKTINWIKYGGLFFAANASEATPDEQIYVARKIQPDPPDQDGCQPGGW